MIAPNQVEGVGTSPMARNPIPDTHGSLQKSMGDITDTSAFFRAWAKQRWCRLANGVGRIVWGTMSDKIGRRRSVAIMTTVQALILFSFTSMAGNEYLLYFGAMLIGFNFGGNFALFPTLTTDVFGNDRIGQNYPFIFLSHGVGGITGPLLGGNLGDLGNFPLAFSNCGFACLAGSACIMLVKKPDHNEALRPASVHGFMHQMHLDHFEDIVEYAVHPEHFKRVVKQKSLERVRNSS
jgi:OFA family oxalate/formate antiporter-like MFS transporter